MLVEVLVEVLVAVIVVYLVNKVCGSFTSLSTSGAVECSKQDGVLAMRKWGNVGVECLYSICTFQSYSCGACNTFQKFICQVLSCETFKLTD